MNALDRQTLERFLLEQVEDLEELQILLHLDTLPETDAATLEQITEATRLPAAIGLRSLRSLAARGLVSCSAIEPALYRFDPAQAETRAIFRQVAAVYREDPLVIIKLMTSHAIERVRTSALRAFADCFKIGRPKSNG